jgi:NADH-quinone oxidoreductase subunit M
MTLILLLAVPLLGGLLAWATGRLGKILPWLVSLLALGVDLVILVGAFPGIPRVVAASGGFPFFQEVSLPWIRELDVSFTLAMDGLSFLMCGLTIFLGLMAVLAAWKELGERPGFLHFNLLMVLCGILGVFLSVDLLLFFFFWELMLVPMYFLISLWGHEGRARASMKFLLFTQASGLVLLLSILGLSYLHWKATGAHTFDFRELALPALGQRASLLCVIGFGLAFGVKLPSVPLHTWLPDAHTEAPTAGSVILAGLLLKTGAYGFLRFVLFLFPAAVARLAPVGMALGAAGVLYGALLTFAQRDFKRLVAYSSVSHMGFVLLGVFAGNGQALAGAVLIMISHGISSGALFILSGIIHDRLGSRDLEKMGGLLGQVPRLAGAGVLFVFAAVGLPGMGNFAGEVLVLLGSARVSMPFAVLAAGGIVLSIIYGLRMVQMVYLGPRREASDLRDLTIRESFVLFLLGIAILALGLHPRPVIERAKAALETVQSPRTGGER